MEDADDSKYTDVDAPPEEEPTHRRDSRLGPGTEVGGYIIDGELGHGGMGVVYSATHPVIGKRAAIKVLRPELSKQPIAVERFIREARAVNEIGHPNIVDIFAFDKLSDGRAYLVMDLLVGESLRKRLRRGPCHFSEGASIIDEMASALIAAHDKGFIHRDLKPDNVFLVARDGRWPEVKLLDFGLTKLVSDKGQRPFQTKTGVLLGTPDYMSPEQARGRDIDYRTDIYALGVLMFEILTGRRPFPKGATPFETLQAHVEHPVPSLGEAVPSLPQEMAQLGEAMLAKNPEGRPSLAAVRTVIKRLRSNTLIPTMSVASLEVSVPPKPAEPLGLTASRVGAEPIVPSAPGLAPQPIAQGTAPALPSKPSPAASGAKWPSTVPGTVPSVDPRSRAPSQPQPSNPGTRPSPQSVRPPSNPSNPGMPAQAPANPAMTSGVRAPAQPSNPAAQASNPTMRPPSSPQPQASNPTMRPPSSPQPSQPQASNPTMRAPSSPHPQASNPTMRPPSNPQPGGAANPQPSNPGMPAQPRAPGTAGLRAPGSPLAETTFGVPPPPVRPPDYLRRPSVPPANKPVEQAAPARSSRTWIVIGALIAIAIGIAIALALV